MADAAATAPDAQLLRAFRERVRAVVARDLELELRDAERLRDETLPKLRGAIAEARVRGECDRAWLFGSFAWGRPGERSDIDVLVEACRNPDGLAALLWRACGRPVHVIELGVAPAGLVDRVAREGTAL
jgi:predicted nucleotidyltransferase